MVADKRTVAAKAPIGDDALADPTEVAAAYERHITRTGLAAQTTRSYSGQVRRFCGWLSTQAEHDPADVFTNPFGRDYAVRDYRTYLTAELRQAPTSVDQALAALRSLFQWIGLGPADAKRVASSRRDLPPHLSPPEIKAVLRAAERRGPRDLAIIGLGMFAGLRVSELHQLNVDDVWTSDRKGEVDVHGKGGRRRKVELNNSARLTLRGWEAARRSWPGAETAALFLSNTGARLPITPWPPPAGTPGSKTSTPTAYGTRWPDSSSSQESP
jgi:site-specific recombinase XerD